MPRVGIDEVNEAVDLVDRGDPAHAAEGLRELGGEAHDVILCGGRSITELICNGGSNRNAV